MDLKTTTLLFCFVFGLVMLIFTTLHNYMVRTNQLVHKVNALQKELDELKAIPQPQSTLSATVSGVITADQWRDQWKGSVWWDK